MELEFGIGEAIATPHQDNPVRNPQVGDFIKEKAIALPEDLALYIALNAKLQELAAEFGNFDDRIELVPLGANQSVDYILGEFTSESAELLNQSLANKSYADLAKIPGRDFKKLHQRCNLTEVLNHDF